jgi:hypothetical protein
VARVRDLVSFLTATGVAVGRSNANLTIGNLPTLLQTCAVNVNLYAPFSVPETLDTLALEESEAVTMQLLPVLDLTLPTLSINATYIAVPSLVPVPPT